MPKSTAPAAKESASVTSHTASPAPLATGTVAVPGNPPEGLTAAKGPLALVVSLAVSFPLLVALTSTNRVMPAGTFPNAAFNRVPKSARPAVPRLPRAAFPTRDELKNPVSVLKTVPGTFWFASVVGVAKVVATFRLFKAVAKASVNRRVAILRVVAREHCGSSIGPDRGSALRALRSENARLG